MSLRGWEGHGDQCSEVGAHVHKGPADGVGSRGLRLEEGSAPQSLQSPGTQLSSPLLCHPAKDGPSAAPDTPQMAPRRPALVQAQVRPRPTLLCCPEGLTEKLGLQRPPTHHCHLHTCRPHPRPSSGAPSPLEVSGCFTGRMAVVSGGFETGPPGRPRGHSLRNHEEPGRSHLTPKHTYRCPPSHTPPGGPVVVPP